MPSTLSPLFRAARAAPLLASLSALLGVLGCGSATPAPDYPTPEDPPIEETEFAEVLGVASDEEDVVEEEDDWVDPSAGEATEEPEKR